jgi:hypothetical protein
MHVCDVLLRRLVCTFGPKPLHCITFTPIPLPLVTIVLQDQQPVHYPPVCSPCNLGECGGDCQQGTPQLPGQLLQADRKIDKDKLMGTSDVAYAWHTELLCHA